MSANIAFSPDVPGAARRRDLPARALTYLLIALLAFAALNVNPPLPGQPGGRLTAAPVAVRPEWSEAVDTLGRGETLTALLMRRGLTSQHAVRVLQAATSLDQRRVPAGMPVTVQTLHGDSLPTEIVLQLATDRLIRLRRSGDQWMGMEERLPWTTDTVVATGVILSNLYDAIDAGAPGLPRPARAELAWSMADIFEYRVDMSRDLRSGDAFRVLFERGTAPNGAVRIGTILAVSFQLSGNEVEAVRFTSRGASGQYFDQTGRSLQAAFLRAPLAFRRISSVFGFRTHPILGVRKKHTGTDYAANSGTPVRTVGDGTVIFAGRRGGYGNVVEIRHRNGYVTRYGHLRGFAGGTARGARVTIGQTIAYVGSTGLSTAPHLHFEVIVGGVQKDPRVALATKGGDPIPSAERSEFDRVRTVRLALLGGPGDSVRVAAVD